MKGARKLINTQASILVGIPAALLLECHSNQGIVMDEK